MEARRPLVVVPAAVADQPQERGKMGDQDMPEFRPWRELLATHPAAELFPLVTGQELQELADSIKINGLRIPIEFLIEPETTRPPDDKHPFGRLADGRSRLDAMELAGFRFAPIDGMGVMRVFNPSGKEVRLRCNTPSVEEVRDVYEFVVELNIRRRHLTTAQKQELIAQLLQENPDRSDRQTAALAKVSPSTAGSVRQKLVARGAIPKVTETVGADGRIRPTTPARRIRRMKGMIDLAQGEGRTWEDNAKIAEEAQAEKKAKSAPVVVKTSPEPESETPAELQPLDVERLAKLLAMLSSEADGEALNAARAIGRMLRASGLNLVSLAEEMARSGRWLEARQGGNDDAAARDARYHQEKVAGLKRDIERHRKDLERWNAYTNDGMAALERAKLTQEIAQIEALKRRVAEQEAARQAEDERRRQYVARGEKIPDTPEQQRQKERTRQLKRLNQECKQAAQATTEAQLRREGLYKRSTVYASLAPLREQLRAMVPRFYQATAEQPAKLSGG
jgi:hypothetical protein